MRRILYGLAAASLAALIATPVLAQSRTEMASAGATGMHSVTVGNTIIEGGGASTADLNVARYQAWDQLRRNNPGIANQLRHNPKLAGNEAWVSRHPKLKEVFEANAGMQQDMLQHPGNYVVERSAMSHHRHHHAKRAAS
jgi:hypothetical protein